MNANTIVAVCAVVIAAAALVVSVSEARATRKHNRYSVRPILKLTTTFPVVNGQVMVPAGGQEKVPIPRVD